MTAEPKAQRQRRTGDQAVIHAVASLAAAISLLERTPKAKKAAPSDRMFTVMLQDYRNALEDVRAALTDPARPTAKQVAALVEGASELADLMDDVVADNYKPDSFTTQPVRTALSAFGVKRDDGA